MTLRELRWLRCNASGRTADAQRAVMHEPDRSSGLGTAPRTCGAFPTNARGIFNDEITLRALEIPCLQDARTLKWPTDATVTCRGNATFGRCSRAIVGGAAWRAGCTRAPASLYQTLTGRSAFVFLHSHQQLRRAPNVRIERRHGRG